MVCMCLYVCVPVCLCLCVCVRVHTDSVHSTVGIVGVCTDWSGARNTRVTDVVLQLEQRSLALRCLAPSVTSCRVRRARLPGSYGWTTRLNTPPALASRAFALHGLVARSRWLLRLGRCILAGEVTRCRCGPVGARPPRLLFRLKPRGHSAAALAVSVLGLLYQAAKGGQQLDTPLCTGVSSCLSTQTERSVPSVESVVSLVASATAPVPCAAARLPGSYGWKLS